MIETNLNGETPDLAEENIQKLRSLFPDAFTEGKVDFEKLQQLLGNYTETSNERYNFSWNGKAKALRLAQTPSMGTLRPCKEESKDWDTTQNLYIEGDNLEVLKLLQKSYHSKVKMIYIDPPYNTGKDFVYPDNFTDSIGNYKAITGQLDVEGKSISSNSETNGRYHTDWLNMMYPRLRLARNLLTDDGVIFISIDDNELGNLKKICDEVFGEENFKSLISWEKRYTRSNNTIDFTTVVEHIIVYAKSDKFIVNLLPRTEEADNRYTNPDNDPRGSWKGASFLNPATTEQRPNLCYPITNPNTGETTYPTTNAWRRSKDVFDQLQSENLLYWGIDGKQPIPSIKMFLNEARGLTPINLWNHQYAGNTDEGTANVVALFDKKVFDFPKPVKLIRRVLEHGTNNDSIILDFFSGSATTAHAVMQSNAEDGGNRKFILVQLQETTDEKSEAYKAGFKNICEIGKERIHRAGDKIKEAKGSELQNLDIGFKVLKLDSSNIRKWQPDYDNLERSLTDYIDNFVDGRTEFDVVYEIMLKFGLDLTYPVDEFVIVNKKVYSIGFGMLIICLDDEITTAIANGIIEIVKNLVPETTRVVFKDNGFKTDSNKTNIKEILKCGGIEEFITL